MIARFRSIVVPTTLCLVAAVSLPLIGRSAQPTDAYLDEAIMLEDAGSAARLVRRDTGPDADRRGGYPPLHLAASWRSIEVAKALIDGGSDVNEPTPYGVTPLRYAARKGDAPTATVLLDSGADPNARASNGAPPLHLAAEGGRVGCLLLLLEAGAEPSLRDGRGATPLRLAKAERQTETARILQDWKATE